MDESLAQLKEQLGANRFAFILRRDNIIDESEYAALRAALVELTIEWEGQTLVDREIVSQIVGDLLTILGAAEGFQRRGAPNARLGEIVGDLYTLLGELRLL